VNRISAIAGVAGLRRFLTDRLGALPGEAEGVLHVAAVWRPPGQDRNVVLRIGDQTPESEIDFLLLGLARARADSIVTTGRILREETAVTHDLQGEPSVRTALREWRLETLRTNAPPWLVILTSGRDLDPDHPAFHAWTRPIVLCPESSVAEVRRRVAGTRIEVVGHPAPTLRAAIVYLREGRGARRISIEAGPSTVIEAYRPAPGLVDEIVLSVFRAPSLPAAVRGGDLPATSEIEDLLGPARAAFEADQASGTWRYEHYRRCAIFGGEASSG
jgi:riboflavin biosynthesis pyrimidine reductase